MLLDEHSDYLIVIRRNTIVRVVFSGILLAILLLLAVTIVLSVIGCGETLTERFLYALLGVFAPITIGSILYAPHYTRKVVADAEKFVELSRRIAEALEIKPRKYELVEITPPPLLAIFRYRGVYIIVQKPYIGGHTIYILAADPLTVEEHEGYSPTYNIRFIEQFVPEKRSGYTVNLGKAHILMPEPGEDKILYIEAHTASIITRDDPLEVIRCIDIAVSVLKARPR